MTGFQLICVNRDGCHMWGRKCSLFPEHLISLPLGYGYGLMTGLFAWISLAALSRELLYYSHGLLRIFHVAKCNDGQQ